MGIMCASGLAQFDLARLSLVLVRVGLFQINTFISSVLAAILPFLLIPFITFGFNRIF